MGLDMYFFRSHDDVNDEIYYFRKHADLHGFLMQIWKSKNPDKNEDDFNCCPFEITDDILKVLMKECENKCHIHYQGLGYYTKEKWEETKNVLIPLIQKEISEGNKVFYYSWW